MVRSTPRWRKPDSNHWYRVMRSRFRERLMLPPLDFPPPEKSALTGDENADACRGTDGSNPVPSSGESCKLPTRLGYHAQGTALRLRPVTAIDRLRRRLIVCVDIPSKHHDR